MRISLPACEKVPGGYLSQYEYQQHYLDNCCRGRGDSDRGRTPVGGAKQARRASSHRGRTDPRRRRRQVAASRRARGAGRRDSSQSAHGAGRGRRQSGGSVCAATSCSATSERGDELSRGTEPATRSCRHDRPQGSQPRRTAVDAGSEPSKPLISKHLMQAFEGSVCPYMVRRS